MIRTSKLLVITIGLIGAFHLSACSVAGVATGAAATTGIAAAQEGGLSRAVSDTRLKILINEAWLQHDLDMFSKLSTTIKNGRVLITGVVQEPGHRVEAVRLAWQVDGVQSVINEIRVAESEGITGFAQDTWITTRLRTELTFDRDVQSINYSIDTVQGVVYLMGYAQSQLELNNVIERARALSGVKQVVSYVKLVGTDRDIEKVQTGPSAEPADYSENNPEYVAPVTTDNLAPAPAPGPVESEPIPLE